jgi:4-amino-4-deoxy-L-arabinose transferase-like glycosyltransferase
LRFSSLDRPEIWYDEAATFHRVTSTYADLLAVLRTDGFVPLHYNLYWLIAQTFTLTPAVMRFAPALAGTLMVPAVYFLASQFVGRRPALLAAAFASVSAWLMVFSHDAKMYMHFWLFVTLHVGSLMWWMGTGRRVPFWCAAASGCAMAGLHATGFLVLGLDLIFFLAHPRTTWKRALAFTLLILLVVAGPAGYYLGFNRFADSVGANWNWSGIQWVEWRNQGHPTATLLADTAASYLFAYNFIGEPTFGGPDVTPPSRPILLAAYAALAAVAALLLLGLFPWRVGDPDEPRPLPRPLALFCLTTWLFLPVYVFYCASVVGFASPFTLLPPYVWAVAGAVLPVLLMSLPRSRRRALHTLLPVAIPLLLCLVVYLAMRGRTPPGSIWMPRYLGIIFPALAIVVGVLFMRLPRPLRFAAIALLLSVNLAQSLARLCLPTEPPISVVARDVWSARDPAGDSRTYVQVRSGFGPPGSGTITNNVGLYHLRLLSGQLVRPIEFRFTSADRITPVRRYSNPALIAWDVEQSPHVRQITLWTEENETTSASLDRLLAALGPAWHLRSTTPYPVRVYWTWSDLYTYRRDVLKRD